MKKRKRGRPPKAAEPKIVVPANPARAWDLDALLNFTLKLIERKAQMEQQTEIVSANALESMTRADIDVQIQTAKKYPRNVAVALKEAITQATCSEDVADDCIYSLPRAGKEIEGPSVRLSEILVGCWKNLRVGVRIMNEGENEVVAQAVVHDLEANNAISVEVSRRITTKDGARYNADMIGVAKAAASSIAFRNGVLRVIPKAFWSQVYEKAKLCVANGQQSIAQRRAKAIEWLMARGIPSDAVLRRLDRGKIGEIDGNDLVTLRGIINAAREDNVDLKDEFDVKAPVAKATAAPLPVAQPRPEPPPAESATGKRPVGRPPKQVAYAGESSRVDQAVQEAAAMLPPVPAPMNDPPPVQAPTPIPVQSEAPIIKQPKAVDPKMAMWLRWQEMRNRFSAAEMKDIRTKAEVQIITFAMQLEQIAACVAAGTEILEERDGSMLPEETA